MFQDYMDDTLIAVCILIPALICIFLVIPIPYQHNILVLLSAIYSFYFINNQRYRWRGWCNRYVEKSNKR